MLSRLPKMAAGHRDLTQQEESALLQLRSLCRRSGNLERFQDLFGTSETVAADEEKPGPSDLSRLSVSGDAGALRETKQATDLSLRVFDSLELEKQEDVAVDAREERLM